MLDAHVHTHALAHKRESVPENMHIDNSRGDAKGRYSKSSTDPGSPSLHTTALADFDTHTQHARAGKP